MANKYSNPILGSVDIETEPYYEALSANKIAQDRLKSTIYSNPFSIDSIDADKADSRNAINPFNNELNSLVDNYTSSNDTRSLSKGIMDIRNRYNQSLDGGELNPFVKRYKDFNETLTSYDNIIKGAKTPTERAHAEAQKENFRMSQTALSKSQNPDLNYLNNSQGQRLDYLNSVDPVLYASELAKQVADDKIDLGVTTVPLAGNDYYEVMRGKHKVYVTKDKLDNTIVNGFRAKKEEFLRMSKLGRDNMGVDERGSFEGPSDEYAINTKTGAINTDTEIGAAISSAVSAYEKSQVTASNQLVRTGKEFPKTTSSEITPPPPPNDQLRLYETQYNVKVQQKGIDNWGEAVKGIYDIKEKVKKDGYGKLSKEEKVKLSQYNRAYQQKQIYTKSFYEKHPEIQQETIDAGKLLYANVPNSLNTKRGLENVSLDEEVFTNYSQHLMGNRAEKSIANRQLLSDVFEASFSDELSNDGLSYFKNKIINSNLLTGNSVNPDISLQSLIAGKKVGSKTNMLDEAVANGSISQSDADVIKRNTGTVLAKTKLASIMDYTSDIVNNGSYTGKAQSKIESLKHISKEFDRGLNTELQKSNISQGVMITPEGIGKKVWETASSSITPFFTGTKVADNLGEYVYSMDEKGHLQAQKVDENVIASFIGAKNMKINGVVDYNFKSPDLEVTFEDKDKNIQTYLVNVPRGLSETVKQLYSNSSTTPLQKRKGVAGATTRNEDLDKDFQWNHVEVNFNQNNNIIEDIKRGNAELSSNFLNGKNPNDLEGIFMYREQLDKDRSGVKVKVKGKNGEESVYQATDMLKFYDTAFSTRNTDYMLKKAVVYNNMTTHLLTNADKGAEAQVRALAEDPSLSYEDFSNSLHDILSVSKTEGFVFPNKQVALGLITTDNKRLGPLTGKKNSNVGK